MDNHEPQGSPFLNISARIKYLIGFAIAICVVSVGFYAWTFRNNQIGNPTDFANFGTYFGGLTTPLLSLITIGLLIWSINLQVTELKRSVSALEKSEKALSNQVTVQKEMLEHSQNAANSQQSFQEITFITNQILASLQFHNSNYENLFQKKILLVDFGSSLHKPNYELISLEDVFFNDKYLDTPSVKNFRINISRYMRDDFGDEIPKMYILTLYELRNELDYIIQVVIELLPYINSPCSKKSHISRTINKIEFCESVGIISIDEMVELAQRIQPSYVIPKYKKMNRDKD